MKEVAKIKGLVSQPLRHRYLMAAADERAALQPAIHAERQRKIDKMRRKGFELEATVSDVLGVFVREPANGTLQLIATESIEGTNS